MLGNRQFLECATRSIQNLGGNGSRKVSWGPLTCVGEGLVWSPLHLPQDLKVGQSQTEQGTPESEVLDHPGAGEGELSPGQPVREEEAGVAQLGPGDADLGVAQTLDHDLTALEPLLVAAKHPLDDDLGPEHAAAILGRMSGFSLTEAAAAASDEEGEDGSGEDGVGTNGAPALEGDHFALGRGIDLVQDEKGEDHDDKEESIS